MKLTSTYGRCVEQAGDDLWQQALAMRDTLANGPAKRTRGTAGDQLLMGTAVELDADGRRVRAKAVVVATGSRLRRSARQSRWPW